MVKIFVRSFLLAFNRLRAVIMLLIITIIFGTLIFQLYYNSSFDSTFSGEISQSFFAIIALLFAMDIFEFPHNGELIIKLIYAIYPFLGLILIGIGIIEVGMVAFTFRYRLDAWNEWLAKTMENHTILVGLGNVGTRILRELLEDEIPATIITLETEKHSEFVEQMTENPNVAVIIGDATKSSVLKQANVKKARALIVVTNNDLINFKIATKAKELNPLLRTVIRAFDLDFSKKVTELFDIDAAISTSDIAAPAFVATSFEDGIIQTLRSKKGNREYHLAEISIKSDSQFEPIEVGTLENLYNITILAIDHLAHPDSSDKIKTGAKLLVLGEIEALRAIKAKFIT